MIKAIELVIAVCIAIFVMIVHELAKAVAYVIFDQSKTDKRDILKVRQYIDPIGLLFCITMKAGFSKTYPYRLKNRAVISNVAMTGFVVLILLMATGITGYRIMVGQMDSIALLESTSYGMISCYLAFYYLTLYSTGMLLINLFPIATFNMGLLIASHSPAKFMLVIQHDYALKVVLLFAVLFQVIKNISLVIIKVLL